MKSKRKNFELDILIIAAAFFAPAVATIAVCFILLTRDNFSSPTVAATVPFKNEEAEFFLETAPEPEEHLPAAADKPKQIRLLFFGDLMLDRNVGARIKENNLDYLFTKLAVRNFFGNYDLISANLEGAVTDGGVHYLPDNAYDFAFAPALIEELKNYNFNFFNIANNHLTDQGQRGVSETGDNLNQLGINFSGCPDSVVDGCSSKIVTINNLKIGLAGFSMVYHPIDLAAAEKIIKDLAETTDFVAVNIHWGAEYAHQFSKSQQSIGRALIDAGADLIIGHHPHVVQGAENYNGKYIFYSLGNFIFDQYFSPDTQQGLAVEIIIDFDDLENILYQYNLYPLQSQSSQVDLMSDEQKEKFLQDFSKWSMP